LTQKVLKTLKYLLIHSANMVIIKNAATPKPTNYDSRF
jgi:hypothetical protein